MTIIQPRPFHPWKTLFTLFVLMALFVYHYFVRDPNGPDHLHWTGRTMGTHYVVRIADSPLTQREARDLRAGIEKRLAQMNDQMSLYLPDSEITRFNQSRSLEPFPVSPDFARVTRYALELAERTDGAFDPTIAPVLALWGFGPEGRPGSVPDAEQIEEVRRITGHRHIAVPADDRIQKRIPEATLDLNAVAKGYAADQIGVLLKQKGLTNHYVEIGGDLVVSGHNHKGQAWRIGIEQADPAAPPGTALAGIAHVSGMALAGSGDYRSFHEDPDGDPYAHILDPRTGKPVRHRLGGVTVAAPTCLEADGIATAVFVMGLENGLHWIDEHPEVEALFIYRREDGTFGHRFSRGFRDITSFEEW